MTLQESTLLQGGKYRIIKVLGQGGFGITYLARHTILDVMVCIKEFFPNDYVDRDADSTIVRPITQGKMELVDRLRKRFVSEAKNIFQLNHPGVIRISDIFDENGTSYYVMDYVEGCSLGDLIKNTGSLSEKSATEYSIKIAEALEYIHSHNIAHFDLKPDNIMLRASDNELIIIDFGLSKQYNQTGHAKTSIIVGISKGYSPMEQYSENSLMTFSPKIDVYSLGATAYTLFTGRIPPEARLLIREEIQLPIDISPNIANAIRWTMKPFPEDRCPSAHDFINALKSNSTSKHDASSTEINDKIGIAHPTMIDDRNSTNNNQNTVLEIDNKSQNKSKNKIIALMIACGIIILGVVAVCIIVYSKSSNRQEDFTEQDSAIYENEKEENLNIARNEEKSEVEEIREIEISRANAYFNLGDQAGNNYKASNLIDGNPATAWAVTLSDDLVTMEDIIGPVLHLAKPSKISSVEITNGYCKNSKSFSNNTRAAWIEISRWHTGLDGEDAEDQAYASKAKDIIYSGPVKDTMKPQSFKVKESFDNSKPTSDIVIRFKDPARGDAYYRGDKWNDLCVSEIRVFGK